LKRVFWRRPEGRTKEKVLSDKELASTLRMRIAGELPASGRNRLRFYIREGVVTIYGSVLGVEDRLLVTHLVHHTPGVEKVYDHLTVDGGVDEETTRS